MPLYEYHCKSCGYTFEALCTLGTVSQKCPKCGEEKTERVLSVTAPNLTMQSQDCPGMAGMSPCAGQGAGCCHNCCCKE